MVRKTITGVLAALTLMLGAPLFAQEQEEPEYKEQRTNKVGLYLRGGTAWATGGSFAEWSRLELEHPTVGQTRSELRLHIFLTQSVLQRASAGRTGS